MKRKSKSKSAALKSTGKSEVKKAEAGGRGRPSELTGKKLFPVSKENHRKAGSHGHKSFAIILAKPGIGYEDAQAKGARNVDIRWDIDHGYLKAK